METFSRRRRLMFSLTLHNGFRAGETASLKWGTLMAAVDGKSAQVRIPKQSRNGRKLFRPVTLRPQIVADIKKFYKGQGEDTYVFPSKRPIDPSAPVKHITVGGMNKILKEEIGRHGIEVKGNCSFHALRRTFATEIYNQLRKGSETEAAMSELQALYVVKDIMGHRSIEVTRVYVGLKKVEIAGILEKLNFYE